MFSILKSAVSRGDFVRQAIEDIKITKKSIIIVRDRHEIISFAKWDLPVFGWERYVARSWVWLEGMDYAV